MADEKRSNRDIAREMAESAREFMSFTLPSGRHRFNKQAKWYIEWVPLPIVLDSAVYRAGYEGPSLS